VPPSASSKSPLRSRLASVKAPCDGRTARLEERLGIAPQFTATNGALARGLQGVHSTRDQLLAGAALPERSTVVLNGAILWTVRETSSMRALCPIMRGAPRRTVAAAGQGLAQDLVLAVEALALLGLAQHEEDLVGLKGLEM